MEYSTKKRTFNWKKTILITMIVLVCLVAGAFIYVNHFVKKSLPQTEGSIDIPVKDEVTVITDEHGVPHIKADNLEDLYTVQGYVQAQSRMFQMDLSRRQASGMLSEVVGEAAVDSDKYFRTLGLRRAAEKSYDIYSDEAIDVLEWFSNGVNAYIEDAKADGTLPVEFTLLGYKPEEWTPLDSLSIGKYMAFDLGGHWERQAFNYYLLDSYPEEKALELFPAYPEGFKTIIENSELDIAGSFEHAIIPAEFNGSNNWVVAGDKTAAGKPLLADDPHLGLATPSIWYQMHLEAGDMNVGGVIFAGVPGIILGHNDEIAWGVTNTGPDVQQLYAEKRNPDNENEFLFEGEWEEAEVISEPIKVKGEETIDYEVIETRHGPIVSEFAAESGDLDVLSLRWTALDATTELQAILKINEANNWKEFEKGLEDFLAPAQNFVFASTDGTIAYKANGRIPIYEKSTDALLPLPGWEKKYEWESFIPFDELPKVINPEKGFIATANNKITPDAYPYHISNVWAQPYRYERIHEFLDQNDELTVEDMQNLQMDPTNLRAREFVPLFIDILEKEELIKSEEKALELLKEWDFRDDQKNAQPLIFEYLFTNITEKLYADIPESMMELFEAEGQTTDELLRLGDDSIWIQEQGSLAQLVYDAYSEAVSELVTDYGDDQDEWEWGEFHQVQFKHPLSSANDLLALVFNKKSPMPVDGSAVTPMAARQGADGIVNHGASWRFVIDLADVETGYHIVGPGQSGHVKSPWYADQTEDWINGVYHKTSLKQFEGDILTLRPSK